MKSLYTTLVTLGLYLKGNREPNDGFRGVKWSDLFIFITLVQFIGLEAELLFIIANLIALSLGIYKIILGNKKGLYKEIKQGLALILLLAIFRFVSSDLSFGTKSIIFLLAGISFLLSGKFAKKRIGGNAND